jgi:hypothetical protein
MNLLEGARALRDCCRFKVTRVLDKKIEESGKHTGTFTFTTVGGSPRCPIFWYLRHCVGHEEAKVRGGSWGLPPTVVNVNVPVRLPDSLSETGVKIKILELLHKHRAELQSFHVVSLAIFGSVARGEERPDSDIDILVQFDGPTKFDWYMDLKEFLENLFGRKIDLVTEAGLKPIARSSIQKDLIRVA